MKKHFVVFLCLTLLVLGILALPSHSFARSECRKLDRGEVECSAEPLEEEAAELEQLSEKAVEATRAGRYDDALEIYRRLEQSSDRAYAWEGMSGQVIVNRIAGRGDSAREVSRRIGAERSELAGLMDIWDGDTAIVEKDVERAIAAYRRAADIHGRQLVDGRPIGVTALGQLSRAYLERMEPLGAANAERELLRHFPGFVNREQAVKRILAFEAMASGELPTKPVERLIEDGDCSPTNPCVLGRGGRVGRRVSADAKRFAGEKSLYAAPDPEVTRLLEEADRAAVDTLAPTSTATTCTPDFAYTGFTKPMQGSRGGGFDFMDNPDCCGGWHTGIDLNRGNPGWDQNDPFYSTADGCVRDVMGSDTDWGSATVEHKYAPGFWTSQYGHAYEVYVSVGQAVRKGQFLGRVGDVATGEGAHHLHFEIRAPDTQWYGNRNVAHVYNNNSQAQVGDLYQNPLPFINAHKRYWNIRFFDEEAFAFQGEWHLVETTGNNGVGGPDDMRYAHTTDAGTYARYSFTARAGGNWELWAFIPYKEDYRSSRRAIYELRRINSDGTTTRVFRKVIDQSIQPFDAWVRIGSATLTKDVKYRVVVSANTGEDAKTVAVDSFLLIKPNHSATAELFVADITFDPAPTVNATSRFVCHIANDGRTASGEFKVQWLLDGSIVKTVSHASIPAGGHSDGPAYWDWTPSRSDGGAMRKIRCVADVEGAVNETNEINNFLPIAVTVNDLPDLEVNNMTGRAECGEIKIESDVENSGGSATGSEFKVECWHGYYTRIHERTLEQLDPDETKPVDFWWQPPGPDTFTIQCTADSDGRIEERNEGNNAESVDVTVEKPDLTVNSIKYNPGTRKIEAVIANTGGFLAGTDETGFHVLCYKGQANIYSGDLPALEPCRTSTAPVVPPSSGTYQVSCTVDTLSQVVESDESNNAMTATVTVP